MNDYFFLLILLVLSGIFSGSETALISLSMARADGLVKDGRRGAAALLKLKQNPSRMLITILIGNNIVNITAATVATIISARHFGHLGPGIAVGVLTILILVFGEISPKSIAMRYSERISLMVAPVILGFMRLIYPLVWLFSRFANWLNNVIGLESEPTVTESELISLVAQGEEEGTIESDERGFIERVFDFSALNVEDVMTPRRQVFALDGRLTVREILPEFLNGSFTRIPLFADDPNEILQVLLLRELLEAVVNNQLDQPASSIADEPLFCPYDQPIDELLSRLRHENRHMAIVVDDYGLMVGAVTLEDLLEELVGEIYDESDEPPEELVELDELHILVEGATELRVIEEYYGIDLPGKPTDSVNRWILSQTGRIPEMEESFVQDGLKIVIQKASRRRLSQVILSKVIE
jgi:CBS domain containing-hemolysin-like protein